MLAAFFCILSLHQLLPNHFMNLVLWQEITFLIKAVYLTEIFPASQQLNVFLIHIFLQGNGLFMNVFLAIQIITAPRSLIPFDNRRALPRLR